MSAIDEPTGTYVQVPVAEWERMRRMTSQTSAIRDQLGYVAAALSEVIAEVEGGEHR